MHNGLIRLVLKVRFPSLSEMRRGPLLELLELLFGRSDLNTSLNTVRGERSLSAC